MDCGNTNPVVLPLDHVQGEKRLEIANMVRGSGGLRTFTKRLKNVGFAVLLIICLKTPNAAEVWKAEKSWCEQPSSLPD
jgi:hypothetical protein